MPRRLWANASGGESMKVTSRPSAVGKCRSDVRVGDSCRPCQGVGAAFVAGIGERGGGHGGDVPYVHCAHPGVTDRRVEPAFGRNRLGERQQPLEEQIGAQERPGDAEVTDVALDRGVITQEPYGGVLVGGPSCESTTRCLTPAWTARSANRRCCDSACSEEGVTRYARSAPSSAAATDAASSKSATASATPSGSRLLSAAVRTMARTGVPRSIRASMMARPVLPVAPVTRTGLICSFIVVIPLVRSSLGPPAAA